jgi:CheY-like chemotaxis protein
MMPTPDLDAGGERRSRVLLVDDNEPGRKALARLLDAGGFDVADVADGTSALEALDRDTPPDFVLTDMILPDLDGREVARRARQLTPAPYTILITGWDVGPDPSSLQDVGVDAVFLKPILPSDLLAKLREVSGAGGSKGGAG